MKQNITKEQWDELKDKQKRKFYDIDKKTSIYAPDYPSIGKMIEFLGDDWCDYFSKDFPPQYYFPDNNELCDELWKIVKCKMDNKDYIYQSEILLKDDINKNMIKRYKEYLSSLLIK